MPRAQTSLFPPRGEPHEFRVVHYLGSKLRLLDAIRAAVEKLVHPGAHVCDLFAGSGAVSLGLRHGWSVTAVDIQEYSRVLCSALLTSSPDGPGARAAVAREFKRSELKRRLEHALDPVIQYEARALEAASSSAMDALCDLLEHASLYVVEADPRPRSESALLDAQQTALERLKAEGLDEGAKSVVSRYFGGLYFSWQQALELDVLLSLAHVAPPHLVDHLLAPALSLASDVVNTVGKQFAQPIRPRDSKGRPKLHLVRQTVRDRAMPVIDGYLDWGARYDAVPGSPYSHQAIRGDFAKVLGSHVDEFDLVYADPPYTRDHYSRYYHVLETMARRDEPAVSTTTIRTGGVPAPSRGVYRVDRHQSPFCIKSQAPGAFDSLVGQVARAGKPLLLSYSPYKETAGNRPRLLTVAELREIATSHYAEVSIIDVEGVTHNKFNIDERNVVVDYAAEVLVLCR